MTKLNIWNQRNLVGRRSKLAWLVRSIHAIAEVIIYTIERDSLGTVKALEHPSLPRVMCSQCGVKAPDRSRTGSRRTDTDRQQQEKLHREFLKPSSPAGPRHTCTGYTH